MAETGSEYLVTGGGGFIGSNIVRTLLDGGKTVAVLDDFSTGRRRNLAGLEKDILLYEGDIRDVSLLQKALRGVRFVIHTAALPSVARSVEDPVATNSVNISGTLGLLVEARASGVERLVFSSSSSVYGDTPVLPKVESMTPSPRSPYALSKLTGEHYCRIFHDLHGFKAFSLRYFNVFGPRQNPKSQYAAVIPLFIDALRNDRPPVIYGDGEQTRDFTFVDDVVAANLACCHAPAESAGNVCNIGAGQRTSINELAREMARILGKEIEPVHEPARAGDVRDSLADTSLAAGLIAWKPSVGFEEGLRRTVRWFVDHEG